MRIILEEMLPPVHEEGQDHLESQALISTEQLDERKSNVGHDLLIGKDGTVMSET